VKARGDVLSCRASEQVHACGLHTLRLQRYYSEQQGTLPVYNVGQSEDDDMQGAVVLSKLKCRCRDSEDIKKTGAD
jgi:hypothetical protein